MGTTSSSQAEGDSLEQQDGGAPWELNLDIPFGAFSEVRPLADGTACTCFQGKLGGGGGGGSGSCSGRQVVIKTLKPGNKSSDVDAEDLDKELNVMQLLQHPHIVRLAGGGQMPEGGLFVATENLSGGTLSAAIGTKDCPEGSTWLWRARVRSWFPMEEAFRQAAGVASALAYMHDEAMPGAKILHRDIKSNNLAFTAGFRKLKLFDFGLAKILRPQDSLGDNVYKMTGNTGSLRYMAPEVARALPSNESADCYSFATVMWEMVSLELPFQFCGVNQMTEQVVMGGARPRLAPDWPEGFKDLLARCWLADIHARPSMAEVEKCLRRLLEDNTSGG